jgi:DNA repair protein RecO
MSYHVYTTEGIILKRTPFGEANLILHILTSDLGLIIGSARSARLLKSKLRPALQDYSLLTVSMVKGKNGWKITNVNQKKNYFFESTDEVKLTLANVSFLLLKTITGELPHKEIFDTVKAGFDLISENKDLAKNIEVILVLRVLFELGYVVKNEITEKILGNLVSFDEGIFEYVSLNRANLLSVINKALRESQL